MLKPKLLLLQVVTIQPLLPQSKLPDSPLGQGIDVGVGVPVGVGVGVKVGVEVGVGVLVTMGGFT